jgi:hypothetical protein
MGEHDSRAAKRQEAVIARLQKKHAREVQIEVEKATVHLEGEVKEKGRISRQTNAELQKLKGERCDLLEQLKQANADRSNDLKRIGRERRQWDVARLELVDKCGGLSAMVSLRDKQEQAKKRQHKEAMAKANELCTKLRGKLKAVLQQEGSLMYERKKLARDMSLGKQSLSLAMTRVKTDQRKVDRMDVKLTQRADNLSRQAGSIELDRAKVIQEKKVTVFLQFFSRLLLCV